MNSIKDNFQLGVIGPDIPDSRDFQFTEHLAGLSVQSDTDHIMPSSFDDFSLKSYVGGIMHQGSTNSCTGHSAVYAMNVLLNKISGAFEQNMIPVSSNPYNINPWWVYYWARKESNLEYRDGGAYMRCLLNALRRYGVYSNNMSSPISKPGEYNLDDAFKIHEYFRINNSVDEIKYALTIEKLPVFACIAVYDTMYTNNIINPDNDAAVEGYHAICLTGVKTINNIQYIEFVNSWGTSWGDKGFGYIHPDFVSDIRLMTDIYCPTYSYN